MHPTNRSSFRAEERGSIAILFALTATVVVGIVGLAVDFGRLVTARAHLQSSADAAVLAASVAGDHTATQRQQIAAAIFAANNSGNRWTSGATPTVSVSGTNVSIDATALVAPFFMQVLVPGANSGKVEIAASSKAVVAQDASAGGPACLLALEQSDYGIKINGGGTGSHINANCGVYVNSGSSSAIFGNDKGSITSTFTCVYGDYDTDPSYSPTPRKGSGGCPRMSDPFASMLAPIVGSCTFNNTKVNGNRTETLNPGVHCGGIDIGSNATVTFNPGVYIIKNGQFKIGSSAQVSGNGVFFYLINGNARIDWGSSSHINFKAPSTGAYKGMLVWAAEPLSNAHRIGSHASSIMQGAVYSPNAEIDIQCNGDVYASSDWTVWVVKKLQLSSHARLHLNANYTPSATPLPAALSSGAMTYAPGVSRLTN